jgi:hypothetical protein
MRPHERVEAHAAMHRLQDVERCPLSYHSREVHESHDIPGSTCFPEGGRATPINFSA